MSKDDESASLALDWQDVRSAPEEGHQTPHYSDGDLIIRTARDRILVIVHPNGEVVYGPEYTPDEAAVTFWEAMGRRRLEYEERILIIQHMENLLTRLGAQDIRTEQARRAIIGAPDEARQELELIARDQLRRLEMYVQQTIELGRGLALREGTPPPVPEQVPSSLQRPEANYQGREGLPQEPDDRS